MAIDCILLSAMTKNLSLAVNSTADQEACGEPHLRRSDAQTNLLTPRLNPFHASDHLGGYPSTTAEAKNLPEFSAKYGGPILSLSLFNKVHASATDKKQVYAAGSSEIMGISCTQNKSLMESALTQPSLSTTSSSSYLKGSSPKVQSSNTENNSSNNIETSNFLPSLDSNQLVGQNKMISRSRLERDCEFICGWGAAFVNICVTFPINKAIFRQQLHWISGIDAIRQLHKDGITYLYRGLLPPLLQKTTTLSIMFGAYYRCQEILSEQFPTMGVNTNHTIAALTSGTIEAVLSPFERIQTLMQTTEYHKKFSNTMNAFRLLRPYGIREYYRGLSLIVMRNGPSNVAFFLGREHLQCIAPECNTTTQKMLRDFVSGACLGAVISTFFFPLNVIKTRVQTKLGGSFDGTWATLKILLAERNGSVRELFKGVHLNYTRSFISWGIINATFELLMRTFFREPTSCDKPELRDV